MFGVDKSAWQPITLVDPDGTQFDIIKATQGTGYVSPICDQQYQQAKGWGHKRGVFHYAGGGDPIAEAKFFLQNIQGYLHDAILVLDWESAQNAAYNQHVNWVLPFAAYIYAQTGIRIVIYMSASVLKLADWSPLVNNNYGLWIAGYPDLRSSFTLPDFIYSTSPWPFYAIWQYTNSNGALDRDYFNGNAAAWDAYAGVQATVTQDQLNQLYADLLGRTPDAGAVSHYVGHYTYDFTRNDILTSTEYAQRQAMLAAQTTTTTTISPPTTTTTTVMPTTTSTTTKEEDMDNSTTTSTTTEAVTTTSTTEATPVTTTSTTHTPAVNDDGQRNYRALSQEEFAALAQAGAFETTTGWKPVIPDAWRLTVYLVAGIGTPLVTVITQLLALFGVISTDLAIQVITVVGAFFGTVAGWMGVSHFTSSK